MKYLLLLLFAFPYASYAQSGSGRDSRPLELGLNVGYAPDNASKLYGPEWRGGYIRASLRALQTSGKLQYGLSMEGGTNSNDYWYLSPAAMLNWKMSGKQSYFYLGCMGGYECTDDMLKSNFNGEHMGNGYVLGLQGGFVKHVGTHFSFSAEIAARWTQIWTRYDRWYDYMSLEPTKHTLVEETCLFPVTVGISYRL